MTRYLMTPLLAALTAVGLPAAAVTAPFTETYTGGTYDVAAPILQDGALSGLTLTLANDELAVEAIDSTRNSLVVDVTNAVPAPGLVVTQSVDFTMVDFFTGISRLGFVFGATDPEAAGEGPSDAIYTYISEPSGDFSPTDFFTNAFDETGSQISISNTGDPAALVTPFLQEGVTYTFTSTVSFLLNGDEQIDFNLIDTATGGSSFSQSYSFVMPDESGQVGQAQLDDVLLNWGATTTVTPSDLAGDYDDSLAVGQGDLDRVLLNWGTEFGTSPGDAAPDPLWINDLPLNEEVDGTHYGLYLRSFDPDATVVFDNWSLTTSTLGAEPGGAVPEPTSLALLGSLAVLALRRRA